MIHAPAATENYSQPMLAILLQALDKINARAVTILSQEHAALANEEIQNTNPTS